MKISRSLLSFALAIALLFAQLIGTSEGLAAGKMAIKPTPEQIAKCVEMLRRKGIDLPSGAQITGITVEAEDWVCTSCGKEVDGMPANFPEEAAKCDGCGSPMEPKDGETYKKVAGAPARVFTEKQINAALGDQGANWDCGFCTNGGNRDQVDGAIVKSCRNCGAPRPGYEAQPAVASAVVAAPVAKKTQALPSKKHTRTVQPDSRDESYGQMKVKSAKGKVIGGGIIAAIGLGVFTHVTLQDTPAEGTITHTRWVQTVRVEQFQPVLERAPRSEIKESAPVMPVNGVGGKPGAVILECAKDLCSYETYKWIETTSKVKRGNAGEAIPTDSNWAQLSAPMNGRVMMNTRFDVDFDFVHDGETYSAEAHPRTLQEFQEFKPNSKITVELNTLKNVQKIQIVGKK